MRTRSRPDHADVVQHRLELLRAELASRWAEQDSDGSVDADDRSRSDGSGGGGGVLRPEGGECPDEALDDDPWWAPHTRLPGDDRDERAEPPEQPPEQPPAEPAAVDVPVPGRHAARRAPAPVAPGGWRGRWRGRVALTPWHLTLVAIGVALALAAACWWVIRSDPTPQPVAPLASAEPLTSLSASPSQAATPQVLATPSGSAGTVTVDVEGKVRRPGIAVLPDGSRVIDAIKAAGGAPRRRDLAGLNLAAVLTDGQQIVVGASPPAPGQPTSSGSTASGSDPPATPGTLVDLNTAGLDELDTLPGVGPVTAQSILDWRDENGGFTSVDELLEVDGIGPVTLAKLTPLVTV